MVKRNKIMAALSSDRLLFGLGVYIIVFVLLHLTGMVSPAKMDILRILHKPGALTVVSFSCIHLLLRSIVLFRSTRQAKHMPLARNAKIAFQGGLMLIVLGIVVSGLTRFEGSMVLAEGQMFEAGRTDYLEGSLYVRPFASPPTMDLSMIHVIPSFYNKGRSLWDVKALLGYRDRPSKREGVLQGRSLFPAWLNGTLIKVTRFGYAPHYQIFDPSGALLDEAFVILNLFPPGAEDSFVLENLPDTFYVQYYPDGPPASGEKRTVAAGTKPTYKIRVTKNIDLITPTQTLALKEKASINPESIAFDETRKWAAVSVVNDKGLYLIFPGILLVLSIAAWGASRKIDVVTIDEEQSVQVENN
jgi:hypothetical protein